MYKKHKNKRGETILETVIAMGILAIGIVISSAIIGSSLRNINASKNRIIAINIAREGIEAMRNIRDTNWLKYRHKIRQCWNNDPEYEPCDTTHPIVPGDYIIYKQESPEKWRLGPNIEINDPDPDAEAGAKVWSSRLYLVDIDILVDTDMDHDYTNDKDIYNHAVNDALAKDRAQKTPFKRVITIEYLGNDGIVAVPLTADHNRMRITATVSWQEGKNEFSTQLSTHITDYLGRERLSG